MKKRCFKFGFKLSRGLLTLPLVFFIVFAGLARPARNVAGAATTSNFAVAISAEPVTLDPANATDNQGLLVTSQIYETLGAIAVLLWVMLRLKRYIPNSVSQPTAGILFLEFVAWDAGLRIFLEMYRGDGTLIFGQIRAAQVIAWVILSVCLFLLGKRNFQATI